VIELKEKKNIKYKQFKFEEEEIIKNENNFFNLIFSGSLFDKKKAIFINRTTDKLFNLISEISKKDIKDILIFFEADQLEKKSKIRNLFEKDKNLVCIACYQDNNFDLIKNINDEIKQTKIKLSNFSLDAKPIAPNDSGSSVSPSPKKHQIFLPSSFNNPLFIKYLVNLA